MKSFVFLSTWFSMASAFCQHGTHLLPRAETGGHVKVANFSFTGLTGPLNWYGLNTTKNTACALGKNQSPIDVISATNPATNGSALAFDVPSYPKGAELENLGSTLEVIVNGTLGLGGKTYNLAQFHFHTPSEHRIDAEYYPAEVHFVFEAKDGALAVVGFPIELEHCSHDLIKSVFKHVDDVAKPGTAGHTGPLDFAELKAHLAKSVVYQYSGSLTTPPCTEGISWNVVKNPIGIDFKTFRRIKSIMKFNSRYTQNVPGQINLLENAKNTLSAAK